MLRDVIQGWRALRHAPGFAVTTILTLAIGLGATVTMFAAVNAAFLEPLPYPAEQQLVKVYQAGPDRGGIRVPLPILADWTAQARAFDALTGYLSGATVNVSDGDTAHRASLSRVTRRFFDTMGVAPVRGRAFSIDEAVAGGPPAAIISHRLWRDVFNGRETVLNEPLLIDGAPVPIVGVMPEGFRFPDDSDLWASIEREGGFTSRTAHNFDVVGRLRAGETPESAASDLEAVTDSIGRIHPDVAAEGLGVSVAPLRDDLLGTQSSLVLIGLGAVLCVLVVACVNVANLMLARSLTRETETGIRLAMGAGRAAIVRSVVAEGLVLAGAGAVLGGVFSLWGTRLVTQLTPESVTGGLPLQIDVRVLMLTLLATATTGVGCALLPAWRSAGINARQALASGSRSVARAPQRAMHMLVGVEVALAFVLLVGAGLLATSHARLDAVAPGFRTADLALAHMSLGFLPGSPYESPEARRRYWQQLEDSVSDAPGVRAVALAALLPGGFSPNGALTVDDRAEVEQAHFRLVGGDYFDVLEIPMRRGRGFTSTDAPDAPQVAVVNETLVRTLFGTADPIGRVISMNGMDGGSGSATIVGVAGDVRHLGPATDPVPEVYFSYLQRPWRTFSMRLVIDSALPPADLTALVRQRARAIDPLVPPAFSTMAARMAAYVEPARYRARLIGALAIVAFLMSAIGITGVVSYGITRRTYEFGIRIALGATPAAVMRLVVGAGMTPVVVGVGVGLLAAMSLSRLLSTFLYGIEPGDPMTLLMVLAGLLASGLVASSLPAVRASLTNPVEALRRP